MCNDNKLNSLRNTKAIDNTSKSSTFLVRQIALGVIIATLNVYITTHFVGLFFSPAGLSKKAYFKYKTNDEYSHFDHPRSIMMRISALKHENEVRGTQFDNTWLTYGTDYALAVIMFWACIVLGHMRGVIGKKKGLGSAQILMFLYGVSVLCGGMCHQFFHLDIRTLEPINYEIVTTLVPFIRKYLSLNGTTFKLLWGICVGSVTAAGGAIGAVGNAFQSFKEDSRPVLQNLFWFVYAIVISSFVILGEFSLERPAADIFLAGTTQTFPTCYLAYRSFFHYKRPREGSLVLNTKFIVQKYFAFFMNAPLLPLYPILNVIFTNENLNIINLILHSVLCVTWTGQFLVLKSYFGKRTNEIDLTKNE